jgi:hypothetical protein
VLLQRLTRETNMDYDEQDAHDTQEAEDFRTLATGLPKRPGTSR